MIEVQTDAPSETLAFGQRLASMLQPGDVVLLNGRLGTGKTLLTSGIAEGLGVTVPDASPIFILYSM
jgi:tRNA threonylcarbamoyladenosine biosynthesis protein TsaE